MVIWLDYFLIVNNIQYHILYFQRGLIALMFPLSTSLLQKKLQV